MKDDTVWLSREQMSKLFDIGRTTISRHIKNIYKENELDNISTCAFFAHMGKNFQSYEVECYNLDVIISVGYRVKSRNGVVFRKWANGILKDYMLKGYAVNQERLNYLEKTVKLIDIAGRIDSNSVNCEELELIKVINYCIYEYVLIVFSLYYKFILL